MKVKDEIKKIKPIFELYKHLRRTQKTLAVDIRHALQTTPLIETHSNYTKFIILSRGRSGTSFLRSMLNNHRQTIAFGEIFRRYGDIGWDLPGYREIGRRKSLIQNDPIAFVEKYLFRPFPKQVRAVGFKLFYYHARNPEWEQIWPYLQKLPDLRVIHLKRRNILATHLSLRRAFLTNKWTNTTNDPEFLKPIHLTYEDCLEAFEKTREWEEMTDSFFRGSRKIEVAYEHLSENTQGEMNRIQNFLGVDHQQVKARTFKQNKQALSEAITNHEELKAKFRGTVWYKFFED